MPARDQDVRAFAFHLPQFHRIPENDRWWGDGFTEWTNVRAARPRFPGHQQPHAPAPGVGYYDLLDAETRQRQADQAAEAGLTGFCYYHYWFGGRRLLERPIDEIVRSGRPDRPFLLCWANEAWTRNWDGGSGEVLMPQVHSLDDDLTHIRWLAEIFADPRYARIDGRPAFLVYRASELPDPRRTIDTWRAEADRLGIGELHLARVESGPSEKDDPHDLGFDAAVEFQPDWTRLRPLRLRRGRHWRALRRLGLVSSAYATERIHDYRDVVDAMLAAPRPPYRRHPGVAARWDNSARRPTGATILREARPEHYERWLRAAVEQARSEPDPVVFVNSWNEWAEGAHLEPDQRWGTAYLEATRRALGGETPQQVRGAALARDVVHRATRSGAFRLRRRRTQLREQRDEVLRPFWEHIETRSPKRAAVGRSPGGPPGSVVASVVRQRNSARLRAVLDPAVDAGARVALWDLDGTGLGSGLDEWVVGSGAGDRTDLLHDLVRVLDPRADEWVVLLDDDVEFVRHDLPSLLRRAVDAELDLAMPAHGRSSRATHPLTRARPASLARHTSFVEIGPVVVVGPAWRDEVLESLPGNGMGWGLEFDWAALGPRGARLGIVDDCRIRHPEVPGAGYGDEVERARLRARAARHGHTRVTELQRTEATWWCWQTAPPWRERC